MGIEKHISALLYRYQCVIVPGFGAFLTEIQSSYYDDKKQIFFPPKKRVLFNVNITHNDGLLANHIANQEKMSYDQASELIKNSINKWSEELNSFGMLKLSPIGVLNSNNEGGLVFEPSVNSNFLATSFGLSGVVSSEILREKEAPAPVIHINSAPQVNKKPNRYTFLRYASVFTLMAGIGGILVNNGYNAYLSDQTLAIEKSVQTKVQQQLQQATFVIEPDLEAITLSVKDKSEVPMPYHIVASAFRSEANAQKAVEQLKAKGFEQAVFLEKNRHGMYPVLYSSYINQEEAQTRLKEIHKTINPDAWILVQ